jgi:hypothetical protein
VKADITAKILLDSITEGGSRLTTWELTYPRMIHAEIMTHRAFSRNAASSRAIPAAKLRQRVLELTATPLHWGANQKGMQATAEVADTAAAEDWWTRGRDLMALHHEEGERLGLHKQVVNRIIEPWMMITIICSSTDWANFFYLRHHKDAEPSFQGLSHLMRELYFSNLPEEVPIGGWHLPLLFPGDVGEATVLADPKTPAAVEDVLKKVSTGRCARVSYLTHEGHRDLIEDVRLHDQLAATASVAEDPMHASPLEHPAMAVGGRQRIGNYEGWKQYRKFFPKENGPDTSIRCERCGLWSGQHVRSCPRGA